MADPRAPSQSPTATPSTNPYAEVTVDEIQNAYHRGYITAGMRNDHLRQKAKATTEELLGSQGYGAAFLSKTLEHIQSGWDALKETATRTYADPTKHPGTAASDALYYTGKAVYGQIELLSSALMAFGETNGAAAELWAKAHGAGPGVARVLNIAVDVGSGFIPVGTAAKSFVTGVKGVQEGLAARAAAKAAKTAAGEAGAAATVAKGAEGDQVAAAIAKGLETEGVTGTVFGKATEAGSRTTAGAATGAAGPGAGAVGRLSVKDQFAADLTKFRREMGSLTETQTNKQTADLAEALGLSLEDLKQVVPGQALDEKQMLAYLKALEPQVTRAKELAQAAVTGSEADVNAFTQHMSDFLTVAPIFRGAEVTAGRSVQILTQEPAMKQITDMLMGWDPAAIGKGDYLGAARTMAEDLLAMPDRKVMALGVQTQGGYARVQEGIWPMARELYINMLLARPTTQVRNILGNSFAAGNAVLETMTGSLFSADRAAGLTGKDGFYMLKGMKAALGDAFKAYGDAFTHLSPEEMSKLDYIPGAIPGVLGSIIRSPGTSMAGMDTFFKTILRRGSYYAEAIRDGTHRVEAGTLATGDLADFVARRVNFPTKTMLDNGEAFALSNTFQNDLGTIGQAVRQVSQTGPLVAFFPFMKTPMNLLKYAWDRTPGLQLMSSSLYNDIAAGGVKADMAIGRLTLSNLQGMFIFELAKEGLITGSGPVDPALRAAWLAKGNVPYSVKTPQGSVPFSNNEPASTPLGLVADYTQIMDHLDDASREQGAMAIAFTLMKGLADKTYWKTLNDLVDFSSAVTQGHEPGTRGAQILAGPLVTMASGGPLVAAVTRAIDPNVRETRTILDLWISKIPGYSKTLPPAVDGYGDAKLAPIAVGGAWAGLLQPFTIKPYSDDPVKVEGARLEVPLPQFPWTIGGSGRGDFNIKEPFPEDKLGVELTPQQRYDRTQLYKDLIRHPENGIEKALLQNPEYQQAPRALQRDLFSQFLSQSWTASGDLFQAKHPDVAVKVMQSQAARVLPQLHPQEQQQLQQDVQRGTSEFLNMTPQMREELMRWGIYGDEAQ